MKKLLVVVAAALVGAAALAEAPAGGWPRVYQYAASLNTAVAKNAKTVTYTDCEREMDIDVCYRVKGKVSVKGVIVFGCQCVDWEEEYGNLPDGYPIILMATSADSYRGVTFAKGDVWTANRLGSPLSSKAKIAELGFDTEFRAGPTNAGACVRDYELRHAGFGTAGMVESGDGYDITAISGTVIGSALAPYCSADQNTCPRCVTDGECQTAIAFEPCTVDDCAPYDGENTETGVAFGSFTVKYNKTLASAIKNIPTEEIQETIDVLVPKVFGKNAVAPSFANYKDYFQRSSSILLIEDQGGFGDTADVLAANGFDVTVVTNEYANGYANLLDGEFLSGFGFVVYGERGNGSGSVLPESVRASLEAYIQAGGNLLVTGYDTLGSPTDGALAALVRVLSPSDLVSGNTTWVVSNNNHPILNGPFGDFRGQEFVATGYDDDALTPDSANGAVELVTTGNPRVTGKIIFTDLPSPAGSVGYWNGGVSGTSNDAQPDFNDGGTPQAVFLNYATFVQ